MQLNLERTSLVVAGAWNPAIFTDGWVRSRVLPGQSVTVVLSMLSTGGLMGQFRSSSVALAVQTGRLEFKWLSTPMVPELVADAAKACLGALPETPVQGIGINLAFDLAEPTRSVAALTALADTDRLTSLGAATEQTVIHRRLNIGGRTVNLTIMRSPTGAYQVDLNHHYDTPDAASAANVLQDGAINRAVDTTRALLIGAYDMREEE